jgi:hypothetical protein
VAAGSSPSSPHAETPTRVSSTIGANTLRMKEGCFVMSVSQPDRRHRNVIESAMELAN